ncbi:hypothetical protein [Nonomuraea deserti]|uniref:hypothetical protein n=1 Tax=Nonomuraea deserti TaxID=1848322 RepID=UPI001404E956|nr:hypothetical protein [Nonomuraea deserti]
MMRELRIAGAVPSIAVAALGLQWRTTQGCPSARDRVTVSLTHPIRLTRDTT